MADKRKDRVNAIETLATLPAARALLEAEKG